MLWRHIIIQLKFFHHPGLFSRSTQRIYEHSPSGLHRSIKSIHCRATVLKSMLTETIEHCNWTGRNHIFVYKTQASRTQKYVIDKRHQNTKTTTINIQVNNKRILWILVNTNAKSAVNQKREKYTTCRLDIVSLYPPTTSTEQLTVTFTSTSHHSSYLMTQTGPK